MAASRKKAPEIEAHLEWLGFVRPTGLVVSPPALVRAGAILHEYDRDGQRRLLNVAEERETADGTIHVLADFGSFAREVLNWSFSPKGYAGTDEAPIPDELVVHLTDFGETLRPDFAVRERSPGDEALPWQLLVQVLPTGTSFDAERSPSGSTLEASAHGRMERLLRQTGVAAGLLFNGTAIRLISAPRGESSGWLDFRVNEMAQTAGRPICAAMRLLLSESRLLSLPEDQRLAALLRSSRQFQNEVSEQLAEQVLHALYEFVRGLQAAHDQSKGTLLRDVLSEDPDQVYRGVLTVLLRMVFLLYAEERGMLPTSETWQRYYGLAGLHERLREDAALYPDTMDQRYGAWAQLVGLFRLIYDGGDLGTETLPRRHGVLFDPDRFPFLEGRPSGGSRQVGHRLAPPLIPDGTVYRALEKLLILDGERISYRALDVEQIGSVYETMMGFRLETAAGRSLAIKGKTRGGAPTTVDLDALLNVDSGKRKKWLQDRTDRKASRSVSSDLKDAESIEGLHAALRPIVDEAATPDLVPPGALVLQPSEERRKSGSHYTPRSLTEPIVRKTLEPLLADLAEDGPPTPEQIMELKICDPAMGSGAFLVEACRQLGDALLNAWKAHGGVPELPPDEDEVVYARRRVAQRCIYGVDRNPVAVDLAKVSLWLVTLARDHAFTFLDHALRHGDSLVGLSRNQIERFHWEPKKSEFQAELEVMQVKDHLDRVAELREQIRMAGDDVPDWELRDLWDEADHELEEVRLYGDLIISAFFEGSTTSRKEEQRGIYAAQVMNESASQHRSRLQALRGDDRPLVPFHWEVEFPEVFERENGGFDGFVGNPPFGGHISVASSNISEYTTWLRTLHPGTSGKCDTVAHFFRRSFGLLRLAGTSGLIATNSVAQGDTRESGLEWILGHGGCIYCARRRVRWPGAAAVIVSIVHLRRGECWSPRLLDGREVARISAFLFHRGRDTDPSSLVENDGLCFQGSSTLGMGFTFDDTDSKGVASPISDMERLLADRPTRQQVIKPYIGGAEINTNPTHSAHRFVIDLGGPSESDARAKWPGLMELLEIRVKPSRLQSAQKSRSSHARRSAVWWQHYHRATDMYSSLAKQKSCLLTSYVSQHHAFAWVPTGPVFANTLAVVAEDSFAAFASLQSRPHELWARFFGSSMKDDLRYTPTDVFETFPFPHAWTARDDLESVGQRYHDYRADLMVRNDQGLTHTYNRFHDSNESDPVIVRLRELHAEMDRAVLNAYGWTDIPTDCEFLLDYEIDEENWNPRKKKPYRYRWPDEVHDEVLARLLELNEKRAQEEQLGVTSRDSAAEPPSLAQPDESENLPLFDE